MLALLGDDGLIFTVVDYAGDCLHFNLGALMNDLLDERIGKLCDVAMEGDRGGWSNPIYDFNIEKTLL